MKKSLLLPIFLLLFISSFLFLSPKQSVAKNHNSGLKQYTESNLFNIVRVCENGVFYIYIFTDAGDFVAKFEEL